MSGTGARSGEFGYLAREVAWRRDSKGRRGTASPIRRKLAAAAVAVLACAVAGAMISTASAKKPSTTAGLAPVVFVGNNWEGTADVLRFTPPKGSRPGKLTLVRRVNIIPDKKERMTEIATNPDKLAFFLAIREGVGEGHDQFVDDMYSTNDGRLLVVSRPSFADVVGIDLATGTIAWRFPMEGYRSDHMGVSPDGTQVAVSDSTANKVHILDMATGTKVGEFPSGDTPHENTYSRDGTRIFHASIGRVYTPTDQPAFDTTKGDDRFQIVNTNTHAVDPIIYMDEKLAEFGREDMSSAVRPMALSPDERFVYFQVSFFHGFVEYDFTAPSAVGPPGSGAVTRVADLPNLVPEMPREQYLLDSAHHGIAMNGEGTKLCVAGTMSDYAVVVNRSDFGWSQLIQDGVNGGGKKPYWSTSSADGNYCYVSWSGSDRVSAISYATGNVVADTPVGDPGSDPAGGQPAHPQRVRNGVVRTDWASGG
jgi:DNA-binding beta-propeller fold protein YncE